MLAEKENPWWGSCRPIFWEPSSHSWGALPSQELGARAVIGAVVTAALQVILIFQVAHSKVLRLVVSLQVTNIQGIYTEVVPFKN